MLIFMDDDQVSTILYAAPLNNFHRLNRVVVVFVIVGHYGHADIFFT